MMVMMMQKATRRGRSGWVLLLWWERGRGGHDAVAVHGYRLYLRSRRCGKK